MNSGLRLADTGAARPVVPVGEFARRAATILERGLPATWVEGELSNCVRAASGHFYFVLKDRDAQVRCVLYRSRVPTLEWTPRDGDRVEARVVAGLYVPRGEFQLQVEQMRLAGAGALYERFLAIKAKLASEGLFEAGRKRALPAHPRRIGVVTSLAAAALRDVLTALARRAPQTAVVVYPAPVQGVDAPARLVAAIERAGTHGPTVHVDVLLVVRGGGSIEDLWAFNDERVARAIAASPLPVVSGVGHETDFTIADFVADVRAATPTAAAELASVDAAALRSRLDRARECLRRAIERTIDQRGQRLDDAGRRLRSPAQRLAAARSRIDDARRRMARAIGVEIATRARAAGALRARLARARPDLDAADRLLRSHAARIRGTVDGRVRVATQRVATLRARLALLDPDGVLERGYAVVRDASGAIVRDASTVATGAGVVIDVARGRLAATVDRSGERPTAPLAVRD